MEGNQHELIQFIGKEHTLTAQEEYEERIQIIIHKLKFIPVEQRPKVAVVEAGTPFTFVNHDYLNQVIRYAGGIPIHPQVSSFDDTTEADQIPDVVLIFPEMQSNGQIALGETLSNTPSFILSQFNASLPLVKNSQFFIIQNLEYLRIPNKFPADDVEIVAEIIHPGYFVFGRNEDVWMNFNIH